MPWRTSLVAAMVTSVLIAQSWRAWQERKPDPKVISCVTCLRLSMAHTGLSLTKTVSPAFHLFWLPLLRFLPVYPPKRRMQCHLRNIRTSLTATSVLQPTSPGWPLMNEHNGECQDQLTAAHIYIRFVRRRLLAGTLLSESAWVVNEGNGRRTEIGFSPLPLPDLSLNLRFIVQRLW